LTKEGDSIDYYKLSKNGKAMGQVAPTVFIVDDAPEIRASLSRLLGAAGYGLRAFESAESFLDRHDVDVPGCLLLDIGLPGLSGTDLQRALAGSAHPLPIVFLTGANDIQIGVHAMKEGAVDFLTKPIDCARLFAAVDHAFQCDAEQRVQAKIRRAIHQRVDTLTPREREVLTYVVQGLLNKQIAAEMGTGEKTVKVHRARMMSKMAVRSVPELVQLAARVGVEIEPALGLGSKGFSWRQAGAQ
jgi:FixJ family two-component response regulator